MTAAMSAMSTSATVSSMQRETRRGRRPGMRPSRATIHSLLDRLASRPLSIRRDRVDRGAPMRYSRSAASAGAANVTLRGDPDEPQRPSRVASTAPLRLGERERTSRRRDTASQRFPPALVGLTTGDPADVVFRSIRPSRAATARPRAAASPPRLPRARSRRRAPRGCSRRPRRVVERAGEEPEQRGRHQRQDHEGDQHLEQREAAPRAGARRLRVSGLASAALSPGSRRGP